MHFTKMSEIVTCVLKGRGISGKPKLGNIFKVSFIKSEN